MAGVFWVGRNQLIAPWLPENGSLVPVLLKRYTTGEEGGRNSAKICIEKAVEDIESKARNRAFMFISVREEIRGMVLGRRVGSSLNRIKWSHLFS
ncbi:hypothetical protein NPIL_151751 [Nephila pilipes]|uniref:Uncharacterized protein n=1 Tax=Nephila pilipes TaxID=299642 RepID=A0A8X6P4G2_NEPPI|nr:hypothetical protein NPIL_151751 [Nephila pilipes]